MVDRRPEDINAIFHCLDNQHSHQSADALQGKDRESRENKAEPATTETIHVYFVRESELANTVAEQVVESSLAVGADDTLQLADFGDEPPSTRTLNVPKVEDHASLFEPSTATTHSRWIVGVVVVLLLMLIPLQVLLTFLTPTPTITLAPTVRNLFTTTTMVAALSVPTRAQIPARLLAPLTLIQTTTSMATGKDHQDARSAMGTITFYNGLFTSQTIAAGTTLTGSDGVQVITDQPAIIPAALSTTPPTYGRVTVSAHTLSPGPQGNIPAHDINQACCLSSVLAQNTTVFQGGRLERDYRVVTREDLDHGVASLTPLLIQSAHAAFTAQLTTNESMVTPACKRTIAADHLVGAEAKAVTVTISEHCIAIAYNTAALLRQATQEITHESALRIGAHYHLIGMLQISVFHARITDQQRDVATLTVRIQGTWMYQFSQQELKQIRRLVAGKTTAQAVHMLSGLPGIQRASISGLGANKSLPKDGSHIQIHILAG